MRAALFLALGCGCAAQLGAPVTTSVPPPAPAHPATPPAPSPVPTPSPAPAVAEAETPQPLAPREREELLTRGCTACHSLAYVQQQRMTAAQWTATLAKMRAWGASLDEEAVPRLAASLAADRGPAAPLPVLDAVDVPAFIPPSPNALPKAALRRGQALFAARCMACHGANARGGVGVNLGDEQILQEPERFLDMVRSGRGSMPPNPDLADAQVAGLRAWLETL
ncbi:MAG: hypothetical protein RL653_3092 [Pseudomonadota bacterium]